MEYSLTPGPFRSDGYHSAIPDDMFMESRDRLPFTPRPILLVGTGASLTENEKELYGDGEGYVCRMK